MRSREHQHGHARPLAPQIPEQFESIAVRQREVEQDQIGIRLAREGCVRLRRVLRLNELERRIQRREDVLQRFLNQRMIIDNENLHRSPLHEMKMRALSRASLSSRTDFMPTRYPVNCRKLQVWIGRARLRQRDADKAAQDQYLVTGSSRDGPA